MSAILVCISLEAEVVLDHPVVVLRGVRRSLVAWEKVRVLPVLAVRGRARVGLRGVVGVLGVALRRLRGID